MNLNVLEKYKYFLGRRYKTLVYVFENLPKKNATIIELGTSRSFVDSSYLGCFIPDNRYWDEGRIETWDWGAGLFTRICAEVFKGTNNRLISVDSSKDAIFISKIITKKFSNNITFFQIDSTTFLNFFTTQIDCVYMDHGETEEDGALLHFRDSEIIISKNLLHSKSLVLIDDTEFPNRGKGKYSIPFFIANGYLIMKESYQTVLGKERE